jgi:hypothetical protein
MFDNYHSASAMKFTSSSINSFEPVQVEIPKCVGCGNDLYWYGEESDGYIISTGLHRKWDAMSSADAFLCNKCYSEKQRKLIQ